MGLFKRKFYFPFFLSSLERRCTRWDWVQFGWYQHLQLRSWAEEHLSLSHIWAMWLMKPQHKTELFEGHTHLISQWNFVSCVLLGLALSFHSYLPSVHFWGWDWCWQSLGCWVGAVTWLCDKEATSPLYFTLWLWLQNQFRSNFSHYSCIIVLGFCLPSHQK